MRLDTGKKGSYVPAAKRRVGKGPGGRARRGKAKTEKKEEKKWEYDWGEVGRKEKEARLKDYKKRLGPRGRMSRPGAKKYKGAYGRMDFNFKMNNYDMAKEDRKDETPKMKLKPKTKKPIPMPKVPRYREDKLRDVRFYLGNHII